MSDSIFDDIVSGGVGVGAGYAYFKRSSKSGVEPFKPALDPRANILNRIQGINVDSAFQRAVRKYNMEYINYKLDEFQNRQRNNRLKKLTSMNDLVNANIDTSARALQTKSLFEKEWNAAIRATFPNELEAKVFVSGNDPINAIRSTLKANSSVLMERAFWTFQKNVNKVLGMGGDLNIPMISTNAMIKTQAAVSKGEPIAASALGAKLSSTISALETALDTKLDISKRAGMGAGEFIFTLPGRNKPLFTVAESFAAVDGTAPGLIRTGAGLHNVYAPGIFGIANDVGEITERLTYSELKAKRILDTVLAQGLTGQSRNLREVIKGVETDVARMADYMEPNISGRDYSFETFFKANQMTVLDTAGNPITGDLRRKVAANMYAKTGGAFTPATTEARFSILPQEQIYGPLAADLDYARKPWQSIRQYSPTPEAMMLNANSKFAGPDFDFLDSPLGKQITGGPSGARAKTLYLSDDQISMLQKAFGITIGDGELLLHENMKERLAVTRMKRINLNELNSDVAKQMMAGGYKLDNLVDQMTGNVPVSGILGRNAEGALVATKYPTSVVGISPTLTKTIDKNTISSLDLIVKETIGMTDVEKVFGSLKGLARFVSKPEAGLLTKGLKGIGVDLDDLQDVGAIARVSDLKDPARLKQAMISHWMLTKGNVPIAGSTGGYVSVPAPSAAEVVEAMKNLSTVRPASGGLSPAEQYMTNLAKQFGGGVFDKDLGGFGVAQLHFGGEASLTGAGNIGTLEPRIFTLLAGSNPGGLGNEVSNELLERMVRWSPGRVTMHEELMKTLKSLNGDVSSSGMVLSATDAADPVKAAELLRRGGVVSTGVDQIPQMYIPGWETVPELHPRMVGTGAMVDTSQPAKIYKDILRDIKDSVDNPMSAEDFVTRFEGPKGYLTQLFQEAAVAGKGAGSLARGQLAGSRALRVLSETDPFNQSAFESVIRAADSRQYVQDRIVGVPVSQAADMFEEMKQLHGAETIAAMEQRFMQGELVAGMAMRHPTIGAYSMQPVLMKRIDTDLPAIIIPERTKDITVGGLTKSVQTGILPGMAADKDADTALAILLSPNMEEKMRAQLLNQDSALFNQLNSFRDHSVRMQLLKPKAVAGAAGAPSLAEYASMRAAEATKLAISQEEVGKLSTALTKSRVAVMASNLPEKRKLTSLSLLEWLEQQPISGKHVNVQQALSGLFEDQMQALQQGAAGNPRALSGAIASMTENLDSNLRGLMGAGADTSEGFIGGFGAFNELGGPGQTIDDIANAVNEFKALPSESQLAAASKFATPSVGASIRLSDLSTVIMANQVTATPGFTNTARGALASINRELSTVVNKVRPYAKPVAVGIAAAGAAAAILGPAPGTLAPPGPPPQVQLTNQVRDDIEIPGITKQSLGNPTSAPLLTPQSTQMETPGHDRRKTMRARIQANGITEAQRQRMVDRLNGRYPDSRINVRVQDDRKTLNRQTIGDMIDS